MRTNVTAPPTADFHWYWGAQTASFVGDRLTGFAVPSIAILTMNATSAEVGVLSAIGWLAYPTLGLVAGAALTHVPRRKVMITGELIRFAVFATVPLAALAGWVSVPQLLIVVAVAGIATVFVDIAGQSYLPVVTTPGTLVAANANLQASDSLSKLIGPALAGLALKTTGPYAGLLLSALPFLASALARTRVRTTEPSPVPPRKLSEAESSLPPCEPSEAEFDALPPRKLSEAESNLPPRELSEADSSALPPRELSEAESGAAASASSVSPASSAAPSPQAMLRRIVVGFRFVMDHNVLKPLVTAAAVRSFGTGMVDAVLLLFAYRVLGLSSLQGGLLIAAGSIGGLLGAFAANRLVARIGTNRTLLLTGLEGVCWLAIPLCLLVAPALVLVAIRVCASVWSPIWNVLTTSIRQHLTPLALQSSVHATARTITSSTIPLGAVTGGLAGGVLGDRLGTSTGLVLVLATGGVIAGASVLSIRNVSQIQASQN
ncbi:MFS transporter [Kribbella sp. CA-293567]|uniref:MFS transporter n=1 Tax=Kribbella sp. CA-293567 TaxID=3002436 RepID=UPI0022DDD10E|nr:MFS transporter [Kribbella sp. CA-293567]WBQ07176.1 MFS transporter [Kribbella sp. CA-293567]